MTAPDVVPVLLTALFAAAALHALRHGALSRASGRRERVDHVLHAAMALAMAAMPWACAPEPPAAPETAFFAAAAVWFAATALHRRGHEPRLTVTPRRLPYAVGMAAMAWMTRPARHPSHETSTEGLAAPDAAVHGPGHAVHSPGHAVLGPGHAAHAGHAAATAGSAAAAAVTAGLALCLLACALRSLTRDMPGLRPATADHSGGTPCDHFRDGAMALGTAVMLVMPH